MGHQRAQVFKGETQRYPVMLKMHGPRIMPSFRNDSGLPLFDNKRLIQIKKVRQALLKPLALPEEMYEACEWFGNSISEQRRAGGRGMPSLGSCPV